MRRQPDESPGRLEECPDLRAGPVKRRARSGTREGPRSQSRNGTHLPTTKSDTAATAPGRRSLLGRLRRRWKLYAAIAVIVPVLLLSAVTGYYYGVFSRM